MMTENANRLHCVDASTLKKWMDQKQAVLVDVREPAEFSTEHIDGALLLPLSKFEPVQLPAYNGLKLVVQCKSGMRSRQAAEKLLASGVTEIWQLEGGIELGKAPACLWFAVVKE